MNKIVLIIPGFKDYPDLKIYKKIAKCYGDKGFEVVVLKGSGHNIADPKYFAEIAKQIKLL